MANRSFREKEVFLDRAYALYEEFSFSLEAACKPGCSHCCTRDVTATTLEVRRIIKALKQEGRNLFLNAPDDDQERFQPVMTTNQLAGLCVSGEELPSEDHPVSRGKCPFLDQDLCSIYIHRPFGCRCFVSRQDCGKNQFTDVEPLVLTVNTVFLQFIEHMDTPGLFGNFSDVLLFLDSQPHLKAYEKSDLSDIAAGLPFNRSIPVLMIPPEHLDQLRPLVTKLSGYAGSLQRSQLQGVEQQS